MSQEVYAKLFGAILDGRYAKTAAVSRTVARICGVTGNRGLP